MTNTFCFPTEEEILYAWHKQKSNGLVTFRCRGMNDGGFSYLYSLIIDADDFACTRLDLSYNALTNQSVSTLFNLHSKFKKLKIFTEHNCFDVDRIVSTEQKKFIEQSIRRKLLLPMDHASHVDIQLEQTAKQIEKTAQDIEALTKVVETLTRPHTTVSHEKTFENKIRRHLITEYSFTTVSLEDITGTDLAKHETDILLLSTDGTKLIIGEVKHDMVQTAFSQIAARIETFNNLKIMDILPEKLQNVTTVIPLVGGDIVSDHMRKLAMMKGYVLAEPSTTGFMVLENVNKLRDE